MDTIGTDNDTSTTDRGIHNIGMLPQDEVRESTWNRATRTTIWFATDDPVKNCPMLQSFLPYDTRYSRLTGGRMAYQDNVLFILDHQRLARENRLRVNAQGTLCVPIHDKSQALGPDYWITILIRNLKTREWDPLWDKRLAT